MHVYYKFGLLLIFVLNKSTRYANAAKAANQSSSYYDYVDEYDDYYDDNEGDKIVDKAIIRLKTTTTTTTTAKPLFPLFTLINLPSRSNHVLEPKCPKECICLDDYKSIKCSHSRLTEVPLDLPNTALIVDLSHNQINKLRLSDFQNCTKIREINLSNNHITTIEKETFRGLKRLQRLDLANNQLTHLQPTAFSEAIDLSILDLSNNSLALNEEGPFLYQPSLLELTCRNCSWTHLYDDTFTNMSTLTALKLDQNDFDKKINTNAFKPLKNLIKLKLPELDQLAIQDLCNLLKSIDNISFIHFDISCYELVLGTSFNESIIFSTDPPYRQPSTLATKQVKAAATIADMDNSEEQQALEKATRKQLMSSTPLSLFDITENTTNTETIIRAGFGNAGLNTTAHPDGTNEEKAYQVPVSQEAINYMLISIMIIAVIGLIIGVICRKDIGGIKTKCCRTSKPEPKDQVHPTEEIPLNKLA